MSEQEYLAIGAALSLWGAACWAVGWLMGKAEIARNRRNGDV